MKHNFWSLIQVFISWDDKIVFMLHKSKHTRETVTMLMQWNKCTEIKEHFWFKTTCVCVPVLARTAGMGRLVRIARVLWLVVHIWGYRAGFVDPSSTPGAFCGCAQLSFALWDGFRWQGQRQLQQFNLTPESIYLGGWMTGEYWSAGKTKANNTTVAWLLQETQQRHRKMSEMCKDSEWRDFPPKPVKCKPGSLISKQPKS